MRRESTKKQRKCHRLLSRRTYLCFMISRCTRSVVFVLTPVHGRTHLIPESFDRALPPALCQFRLC